MKDGLPGEAGERAPRLQGMRLLQSYHEAGHIVAAVALGHGFQPVRLDPTPEAPQTEGGRQRVSCSRQVWQTPSRHRLAAIAPLAGALAEQRHSEDIGEEPVGSWWDEVQRRIPEIDRTGAERLIAAAYQPISEEEADLYLRALACRGRVLVDKWWRAITVVAEELFREQRLSRRRVRRLLTPWPH